MIRKFFARLFGCRPKPRVTIEPYNGPERCDSCFGPKPPVSDPEEPKDRPL